MYSAAGKEMAANMRPLALRAKESWTSQPVVRRGVATYRSVHATPTLSMRTVEIKENAAPPMPPPA